MKVNFNKDMLIKHKFWVILGLALPVVLAALFILLVPVADAIATQRKKLDADLAAIKKIGPPFINAEAIEKIKALYDKSANKESEIWGKVFRDQADAFFWPADFEKKYPFQSGKFLRELKYLEAGASPVADDDNHFTGTLTFKNNLLIRVKNKAGKEETFYRVAPSDMKLDSDFFNLEKDREVTITYQTARYFNDKLHDTEQSDFSRTYLSQIRPILDIVEPVNEEGEGVVQLRDWLVPKRSLELPHEKGVESKFIRYVLKWDTNIDISEEAWLAQEDLWVQKEIFRLIREANDFVAKMERDEAQSKGKVGVFRNPYFEVRLELAGDNKLNVIVKNLRNQRQKLEVNFRVRFNEDRNLPWEKIHIEGEPLDPIDQKDGKGNRTDTFTQQIDIPGGPQRTGVFEVHQMLTWETAAIRRIDQVSVGSMAMEDTSVNQRIYPEGTRTLVLPKLDDPLLDPLAAPVPGDEVRQPMFAPGGGPGGLGGAAGQVELTQHMLIKNRYVEVNEQARRLPVAVALIVDQDHIDRVLTAFGNSKFRFVLSQVLVNRYPGSVRPILPLKDEKGGDFGIRFPFNAPPPGGEARGPGPMFRGEGMLPGAGGQPGENGESAETEANVELVIYGIMTLYERFPVRPPMAVPAEKKL